jgi:hypothetical protein
MREGAGLVIAIGMSMLFGAYAVGLWGYCLVRGYDVPFSALFAGRWPGQAKAPAKAPAKTGA